MKKIVLYFGSFNPIHNGHVGLARYIIEAKVADELWFVVTPMNPLKIKSDMIGDAERYALVEKAIVAENSMRACDIELSMPQPNYTINTLQHLSAKYPNDEFVLLIGADNMEIFHKWKGYRKILDNYKIYVYPRAKVEIKIEDYPEMQVLSEAPLFDISSTQIREMVQRGERVDHLIP